MHRQPGFPAEGQHLYVQFSQRMTDIHRQHQSAERLAVHQVIGDEPAPVGAQRLRRPGIAVAWKVHQMQPAAQGEEVDLLGAPRRLAGPGEAPLSGDGIDGTGLADVGTARKGDLRPLVRG